MKKWVIGAVGLACVVGVLGGSAFVMTGMLLFPYRAHAWWEQESHPAECQTQWMHDSFLDHREGAPAATPIDFSCDEALTIPGDDRFVDNDGGWRIHYRVYPFEKNAENGAAQNANPAPPIWLHVHGVTGNYLHGTRYLRAAKRLGFQLAALDLSNHGLSQNDGRGAAYGCREWHDLVAVINDLRVKDGDRDILITATSMGTMVVGDAAPALMSGDPDRHIVAVALESAIPSVHGVVFDGFQTPPAPASMLELGILAAKLRSGYDFSTCRAVDGLSTLNRAVLVQHPGADQLLPESLEREMFEALPNKLAREFKVYPRAKHSQAWNYDPVGFEHDIKALWERGLLLRSTPGR